MTAAFLALGFGYAGMLAWAAAAAIPIVIHLLSRRRHREAAWAAMQFLRAAMRKHARRIRLEQWLLLALRVAMLLLLALALADPLWQPSPSVAAGSTPTPTHWLFVLDASYSMQQSSGQQSAFEQAKSAMRDLVEQAATGDGFSVILMANPIQVLIGPPTRDRRELLAELEALQPRDSGAALTLALNESLRVLTQAGREFPELRRRRVVMFSDLQAITWNETARSECRELLGKLAETAELRLIETGPKIAAANLAASDLQAVEALHIVGEMAGFRADVRNLSDSPQETSCELLLNGRVVQRGALRVDPQSSASWSAACELNQVGDEQLEFRIGQDALEVDNFRRLSVPVRQASRILCIEGSPGAARALVLALDPQEESQRRVQWELTAETALVEKDLAQYDGVWLCNVARLHRAESAALRTYVDGGGSLLVVLGDQVQADNYNDELLDQQGLLPARLLEVSRRGEFRLDPLDYRSWLTKPFEGAPQAGLLTTPIWKYWRLEPTPRATTLLGLSSGDPAVLETEVSQGSVFLCALDATHPAAAPRPQDQWGGLAAWPSFPPLVQQLLQACVRRRDAQRNVLVGQPLRAIWNHAPAVDSVQVILPDQSSTALARSDTDAEKPWEFLATSRAGFYELKTLDEQRCFAVNLDVSESDLQTINPDDLPHQIHREDDDSALTAKVDATLQQEGLFRYFLGAVLLLVVAESLLASHFRRRQA